MVVHVILKVARFAALYQLLQCEVSVMSTVQSCDIDQDEL